MLQGVFDKYDNIRLQTRILSATLCLVIMGFSIQQDIRTISLFSIIASLLFFFVESYWRGRYGKKYVHRYRHIRYHINNGLPLAAISVLDLTDTYKGVPRRLDRVLESMKEPEQVVFYSILACGGLAVWVLMPIW
jgi:hypothetical protein